MTEAAKSSLAQGFVVVVEDCRMKNSVSIYLSRIRGDKKTTTCGPDRLEILKAVQDFLVENRRVVLLTRAHPEGSEKEKLIRHIKGYYPEIKVVPMTPI